MQPSAVWRNGFRGSVRGVILWLWALSLAVRCWSGPIPGYDKLVWHDEFEGAELDASKWHPWVLGQWGDAVAQYTMDAVEVTGGNLVISTYTDGSGDHWTGMVVTKDTFRHAYGYWEARINFNDSPAGWSAFWLLPDDPWNQNYNYTVNGMEVDVIEHRAADAWGNNVENVAHVAVHWWNPSRGRIDQMYRSLRPAGMANGTWHTYGVLWEPEPLGYSFYIDGQMVWRFPWSPPIEEWIVLSTIVKDDNWAGSVPPGGYGSIEETSTRFIIDYVSVWDVPEPTAWLVHGIAVASVLMRCRSRAGSRRRG